MAQTEVYEVATFYAHFDVVKEDETPPPPLTIRVCDSLTCEMMGAAKLLSALPGKVGSKVRVVRAPCMGRCDKAPVAEVGHRHVENATVESLAAAAKGDHHPEIPLYKDFAAYTKEGGYSLLKDCLAGKRKAEDLVKIMSDSTIRGLGGAGFPTGRKWGFVRGYPGPRLMAVNGDEGEPGTFKDRFYLEQDPHRVLEGMLVAAWVVEADAVYFYLRDEYPGVREVLLKEIEKVRAAGLDKKTKIHLRRGAGAYICGEESAMIESIEGKRGAIARPTLPKSVSSTARPWCRTWKRCSGFATSSRRDRNGSRHAATASACTAIRSRVGSRSRASSSRRLAPPPRN